MQRIVLLLSIILSCKIHCKELGYDGFLISKRKCACFYYEDLPTKFNLQWHKELKNKPTEEEISLPDYIY